MILLTLTGLLLIGWLLGGLVNTIADVLPRTRRLGAPICIACGAPMRLADALLLRPCAACGESRSRRVWVVQVLAVGITVGLWFFPSTRIDFWLSLPLLTYFGVVAVIDLEHRLILHVESAFGAALGLVTGVILRGWQATLLGGVAGLGLMAGMYLLGWAVAKGLGKLRGQVIEEEALGFGDVLLGGVLGLVLGWPGIALGVIYTIFIAGAGSLLILGAQLFRRRYEPFAPFAYGPYLLLATIVLLYFH
jgi:leader peptidase (prepilin peptidase)/N-methyltransferase